jgi:hypothetical protein
VSTAGEAFGSVKPLQRSEQRYGRGAGDLPARRLESGPRRRRSVGAGAKKGQHVALCTSTSWHAGSCGTRAAAAAKDPERSDTRAGGKKPPNTDRRLPPPHRAAVTLPR